MTPTLCLLSMFVGFAANGDGTVVDIAADPPEVRLVGPRASYTLLVNGKTSDGSLLDLTRDARYRVSSPEIATVNDAGVIEARGDGATQIVIETAGKQAVVKVTVSGTKVIRQPHFENDVVPLLSRYGCNASGCHGNAEGQNGFKLSVFGSDPTADLAALVKEGRGRRLLFESPAQSLLLMKATGMMPHGGGSRLPVGGKDYETVKAWIAAGAPLGDPAAPKVTGLRVEPRERQLGMKGRQQLRVVARYSDGRDVDVTALARFQSNQEGLAAVNANGLVSVGEMPGQVAVMASFLEQVAVFRTLVPRKEKIANYPKLPENNVIDGLVFRQLKQLNLLPSELADDAEYLRRVYLDVIGTLPTPAEARKFLSDTRPDKRARLVDELLERPEYADYWALKWADVLRVDRQALGPRRAYAFHRWIRESVAANKPFDQFARDIILAEGLAEESAPVAFYAATGGAGNRASSIVQVFLGLRIACAECHHHPFDRWSQTDYFGMQAFFAQLGSKPSARGDLLLATGDPQTKHPRTGQVIHAHALGTPMPAASSAGDRRQALAKWLTASDNPWFARNLANRVWAHFLGRGLVEPIDDVRDTNPPSNPELLDALAKQVVATRFDVKQLIRAITASRVYQLASRPNATNEKDEMNYSRSLFRRLDAEVLLDMVSQTTGVSERFENMPPETRALHLWDNKVEHYFLKLFGRPPRSSSCDCERNREPGIAQVLHLMNAPQIHAKLTHERGTVAKLAKSKLDEAALAEELYLTFFSRLPSASERAAAVNHLAREPARRRQAAEDLAWSLMNSLEFVFQH